MKNLKLVLSSAAIATGVFLSNPLSVLAETSPTLVPGAAGQIDIGPQGQFSQLGKVTFPLLIQGLVKFVLVVAAIVFFFVLVIGGIQWIMSGGDKAGAETARKRITAALVGLAIVFVAWAIIQLIGVMFDIQLLQLNIPTFTGK